MVESSDRLQDIDDLMERLRELLQVEVDRGADLEKEVISCSTYGFTIAYVPDGQRYMV